MGRVPHVRQGVRGPKTMGEAPTIAFDVSTRNGSNPGNQSQLKTTLPFVIPSEVEGSAISLNPKPNLMLCIRARL
jgi:hypothetical protein